MEFENSMFDDRDPLIKGDNDEVTSVDPQPEDQGALEVPNSSPSWAQADIPAIISSDDLATTDQTEALKNRWQGEWGKINVGLEFASTSKGDLWLRWGDKRLLVMYKNRPGEFLTPSKIHRYYGADVAKVLGVLGDPQLSSQVVGALQSSENRLGKIAGAMPAESIGLQDLGAATQSASDATEVAETSLQQLTDAELDEVLRVTDPPMTAHEVQGVLKAVKTERGRLTNYQAAISERDEHLKRERLKLDLAEKDGLDEEVKQGIKDRIRNLEQERAELLEEASASIKELRSQINRIREMIQCILNEDEMLAERIRTLFREQEITIASILTAIGLAISTLVLALTGGGVVLPAGRLHQTRAG